MPLLRDLAIAPYFADVVDPRVERTRDHALLDIMIIAIAASICGADSWVAVEEFGQAKRAWLETILTLPNGIPSHDTFGRVFARLDPAQFQAGFFAWVQALQQVRGDLIAIDGKTHRGSFDQATGKAALHLVSAWASENRLILGQVAVDAKSNEITAIPQLLALLDLTDCTVTLDAFGCHTAIAEQIVRQGGDYILALKGNQATIHTDVIALFADARTAPHTVDGLTLAAQISAGHGRQETRQAWVISDPDTIAYLNDRGRWPGLGCVIMIAAERTLAGRTTTEQRYYLASGILDAARANTLIRQHWGIENSVHWVLDVTFNEDRSRIRTDHAPQNMAVLRHITLNLLRQESSRGSLKSKRFRAALNEDYLATVLGL